MLCTPAPDIRQTPRGRDPPNSASSAGYSDPSVNSSGSIVVVVAGGVVVVPDITSNSPQQLLCVVFVGLGLYFFLIGEKLSSIFRLVVKSCYF